MSRLGTVRELQQRISRMQPVRAENEIPLHRELQPLFPNGALQRGTTVAVQGSLQLALALISAASRSGAWCGAVGVSELGIEEAHRFGIVLDRFVLIPNPETRILTIISTLSEVLTLLLVRVPSMPRVHEAERIHAKLRDNGATLITLGPWPRTTSSLQVRQSRWSGVQRGRGLLDSRRLSVQSQDRRGQLQHTIYLHAGFSPLEPRDGTSSALIPEGVVPLPSRKIPPQRALL